MPTAAEPKTTSTKPESIAKNPNTPADTLRALYTKSFGRTVLAAIARNPNTPLDLLTKLITEGHAPDFCKNPIAPFVLLEKPDFLNAFDVKTQMSLLACPAAPAALVQVLATSGSSGMVMSEAEFHIALSGPLALDEWDTAFRTICRNSCKNPSTVDDAQYIADFVELGLLPQWADTLASVPQWNDTFLSATLVGETQDDAGAIALVRAFASDVDPRILYDLAYSSRHNNNRTIALAICLCNNAPAEALQYTAHETVRQSFWAASHPNANPETLRHLITHKSPAVRRTARHHLNAPANASDISRGAVLEKGTELPFWYLITGVREKLPVGDIRMRFHASYWITRLSAVFALTNGQTRLTAERREMLVDLSRDANRFVRAAAQAGLADPTYRFSFDETVATE